MNNILEDTKIDAVQATEIMEILNVFPADMTNPVVFQRTKDVIDYYGSFEDGLMVLKRLSINISDEEKLERAWSYMKTRQEYDNKKESIIDIEKEYFTKQKELEMLRGILVKYE